MVYAYRLDFIWIGVLCRPCRERLLKCRNIDQIFTFWRWLLCPSSFTNPGQIWQQIVDQWSVLIHQISFKSVYCVIFQGQKRNFGQILTFGGSCIQPPLLIRAKFGVLEQTHRFWRLHAKFCLDCCPLVAKNPKFCHFVDFGILWCYQLAPVWESWTWVHNYKRSPVKRYQNRLCTLTHSWRNRAPNSGLQKCDGQTDKKLNVYGRLKGGWSPNPTKLGMVIEDLEHVLASPMAQCRHLFCIGMWWLLYVLWVACCLFTTCEFDYDEVYSPLRQYNTV